MEDNKNKKINPTGILGMSDFEGNTLKKQVESGYKKIGQYLINHAEEMSADIEPNISEIELKIKIPYDYVVTLEKKVNYYVMNEKEN
jgi:hypothetical protein|nr:MAG TPA: hypothetical protein [Caudoviricetes sp.]